MRTTECDDPLASLATITALAKRAALGPLPSGWEMRIYFVDHNSRTTTWDDLQLPSTVDVDAP